MKRLLMFALMTALVIPTNAQEKPARNYKPVSSYMRHVGLLYMEEVDTLTTNTSDEGRDAWERLLDQLQDRITIELSESKHPAGDEPFFEMLKNVRFARFMYTVSLEPEKRAPWKDPNFFCGSRSRATSLDGVLPDDYSNNCEAMIQAAVAAEKQTK